MSELMVYKANELAVSRYDLTEHETKLILCCIAMLDPTKKPTRENRTVKFSCSDYAKIMEISIENAWGRLNQATTDLFKRSVEIIYPTGDISKRIFQWVNYAEFNRKDQSLKLVFGEDILPYLFELKKFIKYNLEHVKAFKNKYSMRVYEWLLKELTQRKTNTAKIEISIDEFKYMLMLEKKYSEFKKLNQWVLKAVSTDINDYSNMKLTIDKKGRPTTHLIFNCELETQMDLITEQNKQDREIKPINSPVTQNKDDFTLKNLKEIQSLALAKKIELDAKWGEKEFIDKMIDHYYKTKSFIALSEKQTNRIAILSRKYLGK